MHQSLTPMPARRPQCTHCKGVRSLGPAGLEGSGLERELRHEADCPAAPRRDRRLRHLLSLVVLASASSLCVPSCGSGSSMAGPTPQGLDNGTVGQAELPALEAGDEAA